LLFSAADLLLRKAKSTQKMKWFSQFSNQNVRVFKKIEVWEDLLLWATSQTSNFFKTWTS
jgi:hypothetical protein